MKSTHVYAFDHEVLHRKIKKVPNTTEINVKRENFGKMKSTGEPNTVK